MLTCFAKDFKWCWRWSSCTWAQPFHIGFLWQHTMVSKNDDIHQIKEGDRWRFLHIAVDSSRGLVPSTLMTTMHICSQTWLSHLNLSLYITSNTAQFSCIPSIFRHSPLAFLSIRYTRAFDHLTVFNLLFSIRCPCFASLDHATLHIDLHMLHKLSFRPQGHILSCQIRTQSTVLHSRTPHTKAITVVSVHTASMQNILETFLNTLCYSNMRTLRSAIALFSDPISTLIVHYMLFPNQQNWTAFLRLNSYCNCLAPKYCICCFFSVMNPKNISSISTFFRIFLSSTFSVMCECCSRHHITRHLVVIDQQSAVSLSNIVFFECKLIKWTVLIIEVIMRPVQ